MLIRSQDKAFLLNFNNLTAIYVEKINKDFAIVYNDFEDAYTLGKYSIEAKAIKALDMIQEAYIDGYIVFQMPKDLDVEERVGTGSDTDKVLEQLEDYLFEKYCIEADHEIEKIVKGSGVK